MENIILYIKSGDALCEFAEPQAVKTIAQNLAPAECGYTIDSWPTRYSIAGCSSIFIITELTLLSWLNAASRARDAYTNALILSAMDEDISLGELLKYFTPTKTLNTVRSLIQKASGGGQIFDRIDLGYLIMLIMKQFVDNAICGEYSEDGNFRSPHRCISLLLRLKFLASEFIAPINASRKLSTAPEHVARTNSAYRKIRDIETMAESAIERIETCGITEANYNFRIGARFQDSPLNPFK